MQGFLYARRMCLVLMALLFLFPSLSPAQTASEDGAYRLGPGDVVTVSILAGGQEQVATKMVVGHNGYVTVPFIGKLQAAGITLNELEQRVLPSLEQDYFVNPQIHLQIKEYHSLQFFISGAVKNPGIFSLDFMPTIMDLIAKAGGVTTERGNLAYILRGVTEPALMAGDAAPSEEDIATTISLTKPLVVDLQRLLDKGDISENIRLDSGDTIYIPVGGKLDQGTTKIYVQGKVKKPGVFDFQPGLTVLSACIMAGGFDKFAAPNRARLIRQIGGERNVITIDLKKVQIGEAPDLPLQPGDLIHIPESWL